MIYFEQPVIILNGPFDLKRQKRLIHPENKIFASRKFKGEMYTFILVIDR